MEASMKRVIVLTAILGPGCGNMASGDYRGEALVSLTGTVQNGQGVTSDEELHAFLFWGDPDHGAVAVAEALVEGAFPSEFTLEVYEPPPEEVVDANGGYAIGVIRVQASPGELEEGDVIGFADADLWYVVDPDAPGLADTINGPVDAGFTLTVLNPIADACEDGGDNDHDRCIAACDDELGECSEPCDAAANPPEGATEEEIAALQAECDACRVELEACYGECPEKDCPAYRDQVPLDTEVHVELQEYDSEEP